MRIVAGKYRRRKILANPGETTRPISDRAKVQLFDYIEGLLPGTRFADVFAGTGTIGLEALSRGAARGVFIEFDPTAFELLRENIRAIGAQDDAFCWQVNVLRTSFVPKELSAFLPYDIVFFDPPYRMLEGLRPGLPMYRSLERLAGERVTAHDALLIARCSGRAEYQLPEMWQIEETITSGSMAMALYRKTAHREELRSEGAVAGHDVDSKELGEAEPTVADDGPVVADSDG